MTFRSAFVLVGLHVVAGLLGARQVRAACNVIPQAARTFRSAVGKTNRPFAGPDEFVQVIVQPTGCDQESPGFTSFDADDYVVTIVFKPTDSGPKNVVYLATNPTGLGTCAGAASTTPRTANQSLVDLQVVSAERLAFRFPNTDDVLVPDGDGRTLAGPAAIAVTRRTDPLPCGLVTASCASQSGLLACVDNLYLQDGTCRPLIDPVQGSFTALPPPNDYGAICAPPAPGCTGSADEVRFTSDRAGNLLVPMNWRAIQVFDGGTPVPRLLRGNTAVEAFPLTTGPVRIPGNNFLGSLTPEGAPLPPIFDPQRDPGATNEVTIFGSADAPYTVLRLARRSPVFKECAGGDNDGLPCTVANDCPSGACGGTTCVGGSNPGTSCTNDAVCLDGGECGPSVFEFRTRQVGNVGPVVVPRDVVVAGVPGVCEEDPTTVCTAPASCTSGDCVDYRLTSETPVPLEGLAGSATLLAFSVTEALAGEMLNDDADQLDSVLELRDRESGRTLPIGSSGAIGRAITRLALPIPTLSNGFYYGLTPYTSQPSVAIEGDLVALLEPEPVEGGTDKNGDGDVGDPIVRVRRRNANGTAAVDVLPGQTLVAEGAALVNRRAVAVAGGFVFFRRPEAGEAQHVVERASVATGGAEAIGATAFAPGSPALSRNGERVAFATDATNLGATNGEVHVYVRDRGGDTTTLVSVADDDVTEGNGPSGVAGGRQVAISGDGSVVAFQTEATNLVSPDAFANSEIVVRDLVAGNTARASVGPGGEANGDSFQPVLSRSGRYVAFVSDATNLSADADSGAHWDVFLRDRALLTTARMSTSYNFSVAAEGNADSGTGGIAVADHVVANAPVVAFASEATNFGFVSTNGVSQVFMAFPGGQVSPILVSLGPTSVSGAGNGASFNPALSEDGRVVAFASRASDLVPGDTNGTTDVFVREGAPGGNVIERVSVGSGGSEGNGPSGELPGPSIWVSPDGRWIAFTSAASNLVEGDTNGQPDVFVHDRYLGTTERLDASAAGAEAVGAADLVALSFDARVAVYESSASNLVGGDGNGIRDVFVREPDPADTASDVTLDGDQDDTVLYAVEGATGTVTQTCPATKVAAAAGRAAFLRPESAGDAVGCPTAAPSLNGDADQLDAVVHLWSQADGVQNLRCAATDVALSDTWLAVVGDDSFLRVRRVTDPAPASCTDPSWVTVAPVDSLTPIQIVGSWVAFLEKEQGSGDLNGDGENFDFVTRLYDADTATLVTPTNAQSVPQTTYRDPSINYTGNVPAFFVLGSGVLAFQTEEISTCQYNQVIGPTCVLPAGRPCDLNGNGHCGDHVLQAWDLASNDLASSGLTAIGCVFRSCDPDLPFRVSGSTVKFLTSEPSSPWGDLNGDGDTDDVVIVSLRTGVGAQVVGTVDIAGGNLVDPLQGDPTDLIGESHVYVSQGRCVESIGSACASDSSCPPGAFCDAGTCAREQGVCGDGVACAPGSTCELRPIVPASGDGDQDDVTDQVDNCPDVPNPAQQDADQDGVGDACDLQTCGNGIPEIDEVCDDGNTVPFDGCEPSCVPTQVVAVTGAKLVIKDKPDATKRKIVFLSKDPAIDTTVPSGVDPRTAGAYLHVYNSNGGADSGCFTLGSADWKASGPAASPVYAYKDATFTNGPCKSARVKDGKLLKVTCVAKTAPIPFTLDEPSQGSVAVRFLTGTTVYCADFGGLVTKDASGVGFSAKNSLAPGSCPVALAACP